MSPHFELTWRHKLEILFDGMFDGRVCKTNAEIRDSVHRKIREIKIRETQRQETERILEALETHGIVLPPEMIEEIRRDATK